MFHSGHRALTLEAAAILFDRADLEGKRQAIEDATASIVAATVFLEKTVGIERTLAILSETIAVVRNGRNKKN